MHACLTCDGRAVARGIAQYRVALHAEGAFDGRAVTAVAQDGVALDLEIRCEQHQEQRAPTSHTAPNTLPPLQDYHFNG